MPLNNPRAGIDWTAEYQVSAIPWVTSSLITVGQIKQYEFYKISKWVTIKNVSTGSGENLAVAFTQNGFKSVNSNYFTLVPGESFTADYRLRNLFVSGSGTATASVEIIAGMTMVDPHIANLKITGSNNFQGVG